MIATAWLGVVFHTQAQADLSFEKRIDFESTQIRLHVTTMTGRTNFTLQATTNLSAWTSVSGVVFSGPANGMMEIRLPKPATPLQFFRLLATVFPNDADGDGLPAEIETLIGTDAELGDSDGDGSSDGEEMVLGTDPLDRSDRPMQSGLPVAAFAESISMTREGDGVHLLTVQFNPPFTGTLEYRVNARSTAVLGRDYLVSSGSVQVAGGEAFIGVEPREDMVISGERLLLLDLVERSGYRLGIRSSHVVHIDDNDAYWNGTLKDEYAERNFRLEICRSNDVTQACFVAGEEYDGTLSLDDSGTGSSLTEGIIPEGVFDADVGADTTSRFSVESPEFAAGAAGIFASNVALARTFELLSVAGTANHTIESRLIAGEYTERIGVANTMTSFLDRTNRGHFVLVRESSQRLAITNGVVQP